ncbi:MAG: serine hydrolase domain-containing protein [Planctomycetaceae bacterium]
MSSADNPAASICPVQWDRALELARDLCRQDQLPAVAIHCGRRDSSTGTVHIGRQRVAADSEPLRDDAIFLVASITKPIVAMGAMLLVERGQLLLGDRVRDILPIFRGQKKNGITVRHLLTHTSGLPDMLPNNRELRVAHSPLSAFVEGAARAELHFPPGRGVKYQSMGFATIGAVIERISGVSCPEFLHREFFEPLQMHDTSLGAPPAWFEGSAPKADRIAEIRVPAGDDVETSWDWNSRYWRTLGAPWGGLLTTPADLARFARMMLGRGSLEGRRILSPATIAVATENQLPGFSELTEGDRTGRPWGLGWRLRWPGHSENFGDLLGPNMYGHWGATGTLLWIDPEQNCFAIVLTTQPQEPRGLWLARLSNALSAAFES